MDGKGSKMANQTSKTVTAAKQGGHTPGPCPQCGSLAPLRADGECADCRCTPATRFALATKIVTTYDPKPIPARRFDWSAITDNYEGGDPVGYGATEADAIADLYEQVQP